MVKSFYSENRESCIEVYFHHLDVQHSSYERYSSLLDDDEKLRAERYRFDTHRQRFVASRAQLRQILADIGHCDPTEIVFKNTRFGKPYIDKPEGLSRLDFNASTSASIGAVAVSNSGSLGLYIELIESKRNRDFDMIVQHEFTTD